MLEPREADIPLLLLFLVVLPLVAYVWLGKWSEAAKKREIISLLAQRAAEEAFRAEPMAVADSFTLAPPTTKNIGSHVCARCFSPASTRCSRCKSVRYCSGKCQIIHWRQVHKHECQQLETIGCCSSPMSASTEAFVDSGSISDDVDSLHFGHISRQAMMDDAPSGISVHSSTGISVSVSTNYTAANNSQDTVPQRRSTDKRSRKSRDILRRRDGSELDSVGDISGGRPMNGTSSNDITVAHAKGQEAKSLKVDTHMHNRQQNNMFESGITYGPSSSSHLGQNGKSSSEIVSDFSPAAGNLTNVGSCTIDETKDRRNSYEATVPKGTIKVKGASNSSATKNLKSSKPAVKIDGEELHSKKVERCRISVDSKLEERRDTVPASGSNGVPSLNILKMMGLRKSTKLARYDVKKRGMHKKLQMLFPYEEFMKIFTCEVGNLTPRGLINCGNSCYANAVLQCLMCTKPLIVFLLHRSHSRTCCGKDWCLMCELEQHVMMLREYGGPLSPSRILLHMRNINCQIGDGSQEDAHEFLRLLVASMQLTCLEGLGGEDNVGPKLQETTFIQHIFGGRLRSKVKCLRCHHESERYERIMDLTLEIFGWVESLEDALTQFTTPEELDGENMYRCGRCAAYVHARKQLSIHEAPNILTIVLKRFREGKYGKINKCIAFPDMLDMVPFMTGTGDIPPLYNLYAVVVHLDTLNASFSGHYVAYVKDLQGMWLRIDDSEVYPVPPSQVMSEGAYMLFYIRSFPRPEGAALNEKAMKHQVPLAQMHCTLQSQRPSKQAQSRSKSHFVGTEPQSDPNAESATGYTNHPNDLIRRKANRNIAKMEFDATSSDWSIFTSSDDASFTTESTRDSFSTVDHADMCNADTISSVFNNLYAASSPRNTICCTRFSNSRPQTRFLSEERGYVMDSYLSNQPSNHDHKEADNHSPTEDTNSYHPMPVKYGSSKRYSADRTSGHCKV